MELIRISNQTLKIMLTPTDMCNFEINESDFGGDSEQMGRSFRLLMEEIRRQTDFQTDGGHLSVQYFPSRTGGCEMFLCYLQKDESKGGTPSLLPLGKSTVQSRPLQKASGSFRRDCAYRFEELSHLLQACGRLRKIQSICESTAYRDDKGVYFLLFTVFSTSPFSLPEELDFVVEYGSIENASILRVYIREHAAPIASCDAIEKLGALA